MIIVARFDFVCMMMIDVYCRLQNDEKEFAFIRGLLGSIREGPRLSCTQGFCIDAAVDALDCSCSCASRVGKFREYDLGGSS